MEQGLVSLAGAGAAEGEGIMGGKAQPQTPDMRRNSCMSSARGGSVSSGPVLASSLLAPAF